MKNSKFKILFVCGPILGSRGMSILQKYFSISTIDCVVWDCIDKSVEEDCLQYIRSDVWDIGISFYNCLIFRKEELSNIKIPLNFHPGLPEMPGWGHDQIPLIEDHKTCGVTLHSMIEKLDSGRIIDVIEEDIPPGIVYTQFVLLTRQLCLKMLDKMCQYMNNLETVSDIEAVLNERSLQTNCEWSERRISIKQLNKILDELKEKDPSHRVFQ